MRSRHGPACRDRSVWRGSALPVLGVQTKPIWLTEWGWPSLIIGWTRQAAYFARGALEAISEGVEALDWYTFWTEMAWGFPPTEDYFGLYTYPHDENGPEEKPAYRVAITLSQVLATSRFAGDLSAL